MPVLVRWFTIFIVSWSHVLLKSPILLPICVCHKRIVQFPKICLILDPSQSSFETLIPFKINFSHCDMRRCPVKNPSFALNECYGPLINYVFSEGESGGQSSLLFINTPWYVLIHVPFFCLGKIPVTSTWHKRCWYVLKFQLFWEGPKMV